MSSFNGVNFLKVCGKFFPLLLCSFLCFTGQANAVVTPKVAAGWHHSFALQSDGTLWTWGLNVESELGNGTSSDFHNLPAPIGSGFASMSGGLIFSVAVKADGTLWVWGYNANGELPFSGLNASVRSPAQVGSGYASVAAGGFHTVALKTDGTLWTWGWNGYGQRGNGIASAVKQVNTPVQIGAGFASVAAGTYHSVAIKTDGTLWAWGRNAEGQLGDGTLTDKLVPVQIGSGFVSAAAGQEHTVALKADGTLWYWGQYYDATIEKVPVQIGSGFVSVAVGLEHSLALKADGSLWAWGQNSSGQLGDGTNLSRQSPVLIGPGFASVAGGQVKTVALKTDGTLWNWGHLNSASGQTPDIFSNVPVQIGDIGGFAPGAIEVPSAPINLTARAGNGRGTVNFGPPLYEGGSRITSYTVTANPGNITASGPASPMTVNGLDSSTTYTFSVQASNAAGSGPAAIAVNLPRLDVTLAGGGGGSVHSSPGGIACTSGTCSAFYDGGTPVILMPTADSNSVFSGWTGACNAPAGDCAVTMNSGMAVSANFSFQPPARNAAPQPAYFNQLQAAYNAAANGGTIQARDFLFTENLVLDRTVAVGLDGGYDNSYSAVSGHTRLHGTLIIKVGRLTVDKLFLN